MACTSLSSRWWLASTAVVLGATSAAPASAQVIAGSVVQESTGSALEGVYVRLLDEDGTQQAAVLSNHAGRFTLRAPSAGLYTVTAEMIGYRRAATDPLRLGAGTSSIVLGMAVDAFVLGDVVATARSRCRVRPESGPDTHRLWTEARKVLDVVNWSHSRGRYGFELVTFRRVLDRAGRPVRRARPDSTYAYGPKPFTTPTVEEFGRDGFIVPAPRQAYTFYAPDADILLSDAFLATHCFWVTRRSGADHDGLVGLAFEPVTTSTRADIAGVLWLDEDSAELRSLEYSYTALPWGLSSGAAGGRISFGRTPDGGWMMQRWTIQIPRVEHAQLLRGSQRFLLVGYEEAGGEVLAVRLPESRRANARVRQDSTAIPLDPLRVNAEIRLTGRLGVVRERQLRYEKLGQAHFIWREDFKHRSPTRLTDVLRDIPGVEIVPLGSQERRPGLYAVRMTRNRSLPRNACEVQLYVDGHRIALAGEPIDLVVPPLASIEAIEVYAGASQVPAELGGSNFGCGVIAVWTS